MRVVCCSASKHYILTLKTVTHRMIKIMKYPAKVMWLAAIIINVDPSYHDSTEIRVRSTGTLRRFIQSREHFCDVLYRRRIISLPLTSNILLTLRIHDHMNECRVDVSDPKPLQCFCAEALIKQYGNLLWAIDVP